MITFPDKRHVPSEYRSCLSLSGEVVELLDALLAVPKVASQVANWNGVRIEPLHRGRSAQHVLLLSSVSPQPHGGLSRLIAKIGPRIDCASERVAFERFVAPALPTVMRPRLFGCVEHHDLAALCYSWIGQQAGAPYPHLTDRLQSGDLGAVDIVLQNVFARFSTCWYHPSELRTEASIATRYLTRFFPDHESIHEAEKKLAVCGARYFAARRVRDGFNIGSEYFPSPVSLLLGGSPKRAFHSCIIHGDFNSDNLLIGNNGVALVDFHRTGRGHVYEDIVSLEASIRINYPGPAFSQMIFDTERQLASGGVFPQHDPFAKSILKVRDTAVTLFGVFESWTNYNFAVTAVGLRLMLAKDLTSVAYARITASTLWAAKRLAVDFPGTRFRSEHVGGTPAPIRACQ